MSRCRGEEKDRNMNENKDRNMNENKDISDIIGDWEYRPGENSVRKITGMDGKEKVQMRVDLGLLQMETQGRPDGRRPHGKKSLLEYHLSRLDKYGEEHGSTEGFKLDKNECEELYQEALQYYQRYLGLFSLKDYEGVMRDTDRNLKVHGLAENYAVDEESRSIFRQQIPYIMMMNAKARALTCLDKKDYDKALRETKRGMQKIDDFFRNRGHLDSSEESEEMASLRSLKEEIQRQKPLSELDKLGVDLEDAVKREDFEKAAELRDMIRELEGPK